MRNNRNLVANMLVSFSVKNYRSFADGQNLSLVAGTGARRQKTFAFPTGNSMAPHVLRSACLFGPNGSGKTSLIRAVHFFSDFVVSSSKETQEGEPVDVAGFKLDKAFIEEPSEFEAIFIHDDVLYQYGFAVDTERVWGEWLFATPNTPRTRTRTLFQREYESETKGYVWTINKTHVRGERELWRNSTRDNALFLSTAVQLKSMDLRGPFEWIQHHLRVIRSPERLSPSYTARKCSEDDWKPKVLELLATADIQIKDIEVKNVDLSEFDTLELPEAVKGVLEKGVKEKKIVRITSYHEDKHGNLVPFDFRDDESDGTQVIFSVAGPLFDILENGRTLFIDELHNSLHPHALRFLVGLFNNPRINRNRAQLIFTSHETSVLAKGLMHQDQVWLVEKDDEQKSQLIPLSDFKVRDISAFQKAYLDGRYGAVPKLKGYATLKKLNETANGE